MTAHSSPTTEPPCSPPPKWTNSRPRSPEAPQERGAGGEGSPSTNRQGSATFPKLGKMGELRHPPANPRFAAATNAAIFAASFTPSVSTPLLTSTPSGRTCRIAPPTFSAVSPPANSSG